MVLLIVGALLVAMGLVAGGVLVALPFGLAYSPVDLSLWVLFPLFSALGYLFVIVGSRAVDGPRASFAMASLLLVLATAAAIGLLAAALLVEPVGHTASLWFVLVVAGVFGFAGVAPRRAVDGSRIDARPA